MKLLTVLTSLLVCLASAKVEKFTGTFKPAKYQFSQFMGTQPIGSRCLEIRCRASTCQPITPPPSRVRKVNKQVLSWFRRQSPNRSRECSSSLRVSTMRCTTASLQSMITSKPSTKATASSTTALPKNASTTKPCSWTSCTTSIST